MALQSNALSFASNDLSLGELIGFGIPSSFPIEIYKKRFVENNGRRRGFSVNADYNYDVTAGLELNIERPTLGELDIDYPVNAELSLPDSISPGKQFTISTTENFEVTNASITGETLNYGKLGLDFVVESAGAEISNIEFGNVLGRSLFGLDEPLTFAPFPKERLSLATVTAGSGISKEILDGVDFTSTLPRGEESTSDLFNGNNGELVSVDLEVDEPLLNVSVNPFELIDIGIFKALDVLTEDFGPKKFSFLGDEYEAEFSYTLLAPFLDAGYGLVQSFSFAPTTIETVIEIGEQSFTGNIGDAFEFTAPEDLSEPLTGTISYDLEGDISVSYALAPIGSIGLKGLAASGSIKEVGGRSLDAEIGPFLDLGFSGRSISGEIPLINPITFDIPDDLLEPIVQEFEIPLAGNTISFVDDFIVETLQSTGTIFTLERKGDTSFPIEVFVDGEITQNSGARFIDFPAILPAGENPTLRIPNAVSSLQDDVAYEIEISIPEDDPSFDIVAIEDDDARVLLIGDQVDDRGGQVFSDPHFITFDNISYDFQASGDFVLARATEGADYEVQVRFVALSSAVSVTKAMATSVDGQSISIEATGINGGTLLIDGQPTVLDNGDSIAVGSGSISRTGQNYRINHGNGDFTSVRVSSTFLNVSPSPSFDRELGTMEGLLGDANGIPDNEFQLDDGTILGMPISSEVLYKEYAQSWLLEESESILPGTPEPYAPPGRIVTIDSLPQNLRRAAEEVVDAAGITNPQLRDAAILDFALTGNMEFVEATVATQETFNPISSIEAVDPVSNPVVILTSDRTELEEEDPIARTATFTVSRGSLEGDLTLNYSIVGIGANPAEANDFVGGITSGEVIIIDNTDSATFDIAISDDELVEDTESFNVSIALDSEQADNFELLVSSVRVSVESADEAIEIKVDAKGDTGNGFTTDKDSAFTTGNVLTNDDGAGTLAITNFDTTGTLGSLTNNGDGTFNYDPSGQFESLASGETATDTFSYTINDDNGNSDTATVSITIEGLDDDSSTPLGTGGDDTLVGTVANERIDALAGNDIVAGGLGNDEILGGDGDDVLRGDLNKRAPQGNNAGGDDIIFGGAGNDRIGGKAGNDQLFGDEGDDQIWGDDGDDLIRGGFGNDILTGDDFSGGSGSDTFILAAGEGTDTIVDFEVGLDFIGLADGLTFGALTLENDKENIFIRFEDSILAKVQGVSALNESSFVTV